jgi:hypothetical protein
MPLKQSWKKFSNFCISLLQKSTTGGIMSTTPVYGGLFSMVMNVFAAQFYFNYYFFTEKR